MKKENFKAEQFSHDPKKVKNENKLNKSQSKYDDENSQDEELEFEQTLKKNSRQDQDVSQR